MRVNMVMNQRALKALSEAQVKAAKQTAGQLRTQLIQSAKMPFDVGTLQNVATEVDDRKARQGLVSIVHDTPYATRLYYNPQYNFQRTNNTNAGGLWWDDWLIGSKKKVPMQLFKEFYRRNAGGVVT